MTHKNFLLAVLVLAVCYQNGFSQVETGADQDSETLSPQEVELVRAVETARINVINQVIGSVIAIYGQDRQGGGSGVIFDPSGLALTNHHVIQGAGVEGLGGLADGNLYRWTLIGTDPGGDIALIQMHGLEQFPFSPLGNSDKVKLGDWAFAMGNPFVLTEDETPTVTLGIVSGVNRFQEGAGSNQLIYGNCIQIDSSINPGNSGGPLFNMSGEVIGINGRGSFEARGRVNVGLGYAISSNQIRNFIPDLMATKLVEHGTLDATFGKREGKIVCDSMVEESTAALSGLELEDELVEFENEKIHSINQYLNLICTLPEDWPARLLIRKKDGSEKELFVRLYGLPYNIQTPKERPAPKGEKPTPEQKRAKELQKKMQQLMAAKPGTIRDRDLNETYANWVVDQWKNAFVSENIQGITFQISLLDDIRTSDGSNGTQKLTLTHDGRFRCEWTEDGNTTVYGYDGVNFWRLKSGKAKILSAIDAKLTPQITQAMAILAPLEEKPFHQFGRLLLDGSGKAEGQLANRMIVLDNKDDWFYLWLSVPESGLAPPIRVVKVCSDMNADESSPAIMFSDWQKQQDVYLPHQRTIVLGLNESVVTTMITTDRTTTKEIDDALYQKPE